MRSFARLGSALVVVLLIAGCTTPATSEQMTAEGASGSVTTVPSTGGDGAVAPETGRLLITGDDRSVSLIAAGGAVTEVSPPIPPGVPIQPSPSSDGTIIAFTTSTSTGSPITELWTAAGRTSLDFGFAPFFYAWTDDGSRLAALGNGRQGVSGAFTDLTAGITTGVGSGVPHFVAWSRDGSTLASHRNGDVVDLVRGDGAVAALTEQPGGFQAPEWLEDGSVVLQVAGSALDASTSPISNANWRLIAVAPDGSSRDLLEIDRSSMFDLDPTGRRLAVFDGDPGNGRMRIVDVVTGEVLETEADTAVTFEWSPDGTTLLTLSLDRDGLVPQLWRGSQLTATFPAFTPTVLFVSEYLPFWGQYVRSVRTWAPDGSAFTYAKSDGSGAGIVVIQPVDGSGPREIGSGSMVQWLP